MPTSNTATNASAGPRQWAALCLGAGLFLASGPARALDPEKPLSQCAVEVWGNRDGLAGGTVRSIGQSPDGYLWIAGYGGVARHDGTRILRMDLEPPQDIAGIGWDRNGVVYVAPRRGPPLCAQGSALGPCPDRLPPIPDNTRVFALSLDRLGAQWAITDRGAFRLTGPGASPGEATQVPGPFGELATLGRDGQGRLWLGGSSGLFVAEGGQVSPARMED